jgi:hypothetical protein
MGYVLPLANGSVLACDSGEGGVKVDNLVQVQMSLAVYWPWVRCVLQVKRLTCREPEGDAEWKETLRQRC